MAVTRQGTFGAENHSITRLDLFGGQTTPPVIAPDAKTGAHAYQHHGRALGRTCTATSIRSVCALRRGGAQTVGQLPIVAIGAHAGDHTIYPDCREEFIATMNVVGLLANWHRVRFEAPYLHMTKSDILRVGVLLGIDYAKSWTCYRGEALACGRCGSCRERL